MTIDNDTRQRSPRLIRKKEAAARVGYHPVHLMRLARSGNFCSPVRIGANAVAFVEDEVSEWIEARIAERDRQSTNPKVTNPRENHQKAKDQEAVLE